MRQSLVFVEPRLGETRLVADIAAVHLVLLPMHVGQVGTARVDRLQNLSAHLARVRFRFRVHAPLVLLQIAHHDAALPATDHELLPGCQHVLETVRQLPIL